MVFNVYVQFLCVCKAYSFQLGGDGVRVVNLSVGSASLTNHCIVLRINPVLSSYKSQCIHCFEQHSASFSRESQLATTYIINKYRNVACWVFLVNLSR